MGKGKKEGREAKLDKKLLLKVQKKKFKKKASLSEASDVNIANPEIELKDKENQQAEKGRNKLLPKIKKMKLKKRKISDGKSLAEANDVHTTSFEKDDNLLPKIKKKKLKEKRSSKGKALSEANCVDTSHLKNDDKIISEVDGDIDEGSLDYSNETTNGIKQKDKEVKKKGKDKRSKKSDLLLLEKEKKMEGNFEMDSVRAVEISLVDEDCSKGMKKWLAEYKESRPGLKILQQRIDDFMTAHEAKLDQERKEREAAAAEGGWTVVMHHKGRKKTTEAETGTTVGSVAPAAVIHKLAEKKKSEKQKFDFYGSRKKEAQINEMLLLQSKFEQDKKRIQEKFAQRKFRPY